MRCVVICNTLYVYCLSLLSQILRRRGQGFFLEELLSVIIGLTLDNIFLETLEKLLGIILVPWWDNLIILRSRCHVHTFQPDGGNK